MTINSVEEVVFKINSAADREAMVIALAGAGYKCWVTWESYLLDHNAFVHVEVGKLAGEPNDGRNAAP